MTTKQRLADLRRKAAQWDSEHPHANLKNPTWRDVRFGRTFSRRFPNAYSEDRTELYIDDDLSGVGTDDARVVLRLLHSGWYADPEGFDLVTGYVVKMRTSRGMLYIPATRCDGWDGVTWYVGDAELSGVDDDDALREAARSADYYAEKEAEETREAVEAEREAEAEAEALDNAMTAEDWHRAA
jgi:hypothetical protein